MTIARRFGAAMISTSPAQAASLPQAAGQMSPLWRAAAVSAASNTPATLVSEPSSATSPSAVYPASSSSGSTSIAARSANAIGRSKWLPSFSTSAGARLTVMWRDGNDSPRAAKAERTRSRDSATVLSGNPTTANAGRPGVIVTWASTSTTSTPLNATVRTRATMPDPDPCLAYWGPYPLLPGSLRRYAAMRQPRDRDRPGQVFGGSSGRVRRWPQPALLAQYSQVRQVSVE